MTKKLKLINKLFKLLPIFITGLVLNVKLIISADEGDFSDDFVVFIIGLFFMISLLWAFYNDKEDYNVTKSYQSYLATLIGILFIFSFLITNHLLSTKDKSLLLHAGSNEGFNAAWFEFREDMTYKFVNSGGIGATYFRGTYAINDSIITLDKSNINNIIESRFLAIRRHNNSAHSIEGLFQITKDHKVLNNSLVFVINEDNRR